MCLISIVEVTHASRSVSSLCITRIPGLDDEETKVNSLAWNPFKSQQFISGAGSQIKLWDIGITNCVKTFQRIRTTSDSVQYIQFNPRQEMIFASGNQNGQIDIWDLRKENEPLHNFYAHLNSLNCLDWHPTDENVFITGSNDRCIKVWNLKEEKQSGQRLEPVFQIYTPSSVKKC